MMRFGAAHGGGKFMIGSRTIGLVAAAQSSAVTSAGSIISSTSTNNFRFQQKSFVHSSSPVCMGFEEFFEEKKPNEVFAAGRSWTNADLRRKVEWHFG
jgi:hypothetical protein